MDVKFPSKGRTALVALLEKTEGGQTTIARQLTELGAKVTQPSVGAWARGEARPEPVLRAVLEMAYGIPESEWTTREERTLLNRVAARTESAAADLNAADAADPALDEGRPSMAGAA